LPPDQITKLQKAIKGAEKSHLNKKNMAKLSGMAPSLEEGSASAKTPADATRMHALAEILKHPSA
jgi:hypothetical protein